MNYCSTYTLPEPYKTKVDIFSKRGIKTLYKNHTWLQSIYQYLTNNSTIITDIILHNTQIEDTSNRFNILAELCDFLHKNPTVINASSLPNSDDVIRKLESIVSHQERGMRITNEQRYYIRQQFELGQNGQNGQNNINIIAQFEEYIREKGILTDTGLLLLNPYTSILNLNEIYIQSKYKYTVSYKYNEHNYNNITIYSARKITDTNAKDILYLRQLVVYICLYPYLLGYKTLEHRPNDISLYLVNFPKKFMQAKGRDPLVYTSSEINTGVCDMVNIAITRSEEALKTVLHELFHFYGMDLKHARIPHENKLIALYNINVLNKIDGLNLFEAYTECITSIVNIICWTYFTFNKQTNDVITTTTTNQPDDAYYHYVIDMFSKQIIYTIYKLAKILKLNKCKYFGDSTCQLSQTTNVASYFLFKLFLYIDLSTLSNNCIERGLNYPKFINTKTSISGFMNIITQGAQNKFITSCINYLLENEKSIEQITSARMTCID